MWKRIWSRITIFQFSKRNFRESFWKNKPLFDPQENEEIRSYFKTEILMIRFSLVPKTIKSKFPSSKQQNRQNHSAFPTSQSSEQLFPCRLILFRFSETFARQQNQKSAKAKIHERNKQESSNEIARKWERILQKKIGREFPERARFAKMDQI